MLRRSLCLVLAGVLVAIAPSRALAWGGFHRGFTHVGPMGVYHHGGTTAWGPYGGFHSGHSGFYGWGGGSAHWGHAYGGYHYGGAYASVSSPYYYGGYDPCYYNPEACNAGAYGGW